jgi:hypothetical protein
MRSIYCDHCPRTACARAEWLSSSGILLATAAACRDHRRTLFAWHGAIEVRPA